MQSITITRPDDWHVHFRDGLALENTVSATAQHFGRALIMPNLKPALTSIQSLIDYRKRIINACPKHLNFTPLLTFYLNEQVLPDELMSCANYPFITGAKLYPAGVTTNSEQGARSLTALYPLLEIMQDCNLVLQIHGEVIHGDIFEREAQFIEDHLTVLMANFPRLRIVLEHISTRAAVDFITASSERIAATITPHHLWYNRNQLLAGGIRPHYYCLPILKHESDQIALQKAAISGNPRFFAGTDSAPHEKNTKENACGCAGIYSAPFAMAMYTELFETLNALPKLNAFMSHHGAAFYQLPANKEQLELIKQQQIIPSVLPLGPNTVVPIAAGERLLWSINDIA